jgi:pSer/pThr/pTyr-binding forkhead associated (FHA) protein
MITCPRCHHQNPHQLSNCELCGTGLAQDELDESMTSGDDVLSLDDLDPMSVDVDDGFASTSQLPGVIEEIEFVAESAPDLFQMGDEASSASHQARGAEAPADSSPQGLARLLHDALAGGEESPAGLALDSGPGLGRDRAAAPPQSSASEISDQELSEFLLDALADEEAAPSLDPAARPQTDDGGLFAMPGRSRQQTMELPGADFGSEDGSAAPDDPRGSGIRCPSCNGFNPEGMYYCVYCGHNLAEPSDGDPVAVAAAAVPAPESVPEVDCPSCGHVNPLGNRFCGSCGYRVDELSVADASSVDASRKKSPWDIRLIAINEDGSDGLEIPLDYMKTVVGRTGDTRFPTDAFLSPKHAALTIDHGSLGIEDLYSLNGTFIKLADEIPLTPGDVFLMGRQVLRFEKFEQTITPKARASDGTRYMGSPPPGGQYKLLQVGIGGVIQNVYCIPESGAVLGREKGDIIFPRDKFMSGRHAEIYPREDGTYCLVDLNSSNGTWIKIWEKTSLKDGDFIFMGQQLFRVEIHGLVGPRR